MDKVLFFLVLALLSSYCNGTNYRTRSGRVEHDREIYGAAAIEAPVIQEISSWSYWQTWSSWQSWSTPSSNVQVLRATKIVRSFGGNSAGANCHFPFTFQNVEYTSCTNNGRTDQLKWCATTPNFDRDQRYGFCYLKSVSTPVVTTNGTCAFPFIYKRTVYYGCTKDGMDNGKAWCSLDWDYDGKRRWTICPTIETFAGNSNQAQCSQSFIFLGKVYNGCTTDGRTDNLPWCATTDNYDRDYQWGFCVEKEYPKSLLAENRFFCAFPFKYGDKAYYACTTDGRTDGRKWCSLTHDYGTGKSWSFCPQRVF